MRVRKDEDKPILPRSQMLADVDAIICGARQRDYGDAMENFARIAAVYNNATGSDIGAVEVVLFNLSQKMARLAETPQHADSWRDIAGYAALGYEITRSLEQGDGLVKRSPTVIVDDTDGEVKDE